MAALSTRPGSVRQRMAAVPRIRPLRPMANRTRPIAKARTTSGSMSAGGELARVEDVALGVAGIACREARPRVDRAEHLAAERGGGGLRLGEAFHGEEQLDRLRRARFGR